MKYFNYILLGIALVSLYLQFKSVTNKGDCGCKKKKEAETGAIV